MNCPLCHCEEISFFSRRKHSPQWDYYRCSDCCLVFRDPRTWPGLEEERQRYEDHQNESDDRGYRRFLNRIIQSLLELQPPPAQVLDFGCGPQPVLASIMNEQGYVVTCYDPAFFPDETAWNNSYDLISSTEVFEHLQHPGRVMDRLVSILNPGGVLALMTQPLPSKEFETWHYLSDLTHIIFYSKETMEWMARRWGGVLEKQKGDLFYFRFL